MKKLTAAEQRLIENATLMGASHIIFKKLQDIGIVNYQLSELIVMSSGESLTTSQMDDSLPYPVYGGGGLVGYYSRYLFDSPKIVIGRVGARCGCVFVTEHKAWVTDNALVINKTSNLVDDGYLVHALRYLNLRQQANQAAQPVISQKNINFLLIPVPSIEVQKSIDNFLNVVERRQQENKSEILPSLPPPLGAIRRIVAQIEELAAKVEEARGLRRQSVEETEALLGATLGHVFNGNSLKWELTTVNKLCDNPQYGYTESAQHDKVGPKFLRITDIQDGHVNWDTVPHCTCDASNLEKYRLQKGDILFARTGATTGKSFLIDECPDAVFASYLIKLKVRQFVIPEFLYWYFQSPQYWTQVREGKEGSAQPNMNGQKLSKIKVVFPDSQCEQQRIVAYLDNLQAKVDALKRLQAETAAELDALLPSILDKAFKGEL